MDSFSLKFFLNIYALLILKSPYYGAARTQKTFSEEKNNIKENNGTILY